MKNREILYIGIIVSLLVIPSLFAQPISKGISSIMEEDGSPEVYPWQTKVPNGSLTDNNDGTASISYVTAETDPQVGAVTNVNVCQGDGSAVQCNVTQDGSGACAAGAVCTGGHTHADAEVDDGITLTNITQITNRSHTSLSDIGTNTHAQVDSHISDTSDPHGATMSVSTKVQTPEVENTGNLTLDAINAAAASTVSVTNSDATYTANLSLEGDLTITGGDITLGTTSIFSGGDTASLNNIDAIDATTESTLESAIDIAGDVTGTGLGSVTIGADKILESHLKAVDSAVDEECLTYESTTGDFEWQSCGAGGSGDVTDVWGCASGDCNQITIGESEYLAGGAVDGTTDPYISLPQGTDVSSVTGEGRISWDSDGDVLYVGTGSAAKQIGAANRELTLLPESAVLDDNNPPAVTVIESTGTGTPRFRVADFDASTDEILYWTFVVPSDYTASSNWTLDVYWYSNDVGANETCFWEAALSATSEGDADTMAEQAVATSDTASEDVNTTEANRLIVTSITLSNLDSVAAGDVITLRFNRDANNASDDLSSDARLTAVHIKIPRS